METIAIILALVTSTMAYFLIRDLQNERDYLKQRLKKAIQERDEHLERFQEYRNKLNP